MSKFVPAVALALLALAACREEAPADPLAALPVGGEWRVTELAGAPVPAGVPVTLGRPEAGLIAGSSGCNRYNARIEPREGKLHVGALAGTRMMCPPEVMAVEQAFHSTFTRIDGARMAGEVLELTRGETVVLRAQR